MDEYYSEQFLHYFYVLTLIYCGYELYEKLLLYLVKSEDEQIPCPNLFDEAVTSNEDMSNKMLPYLWGILVMMFGHYDTKPHLGYIPYENKGECIRFITNYFTKESLLEWSIERSVRSY